MNQKIFIVGSIGKVNFELSELLNEQTTKIFTDYREAIDYSNELEETTCPENVNLYEFEEV